MSTTASMNPLSMKGGKEGGKGAAAEPFNMILSRPAAPRFNAPFKIGDRTADFRRLFAFWIDIVEDTDISSKRDPSIMLRMMRDPQIYACHNIRTLATSSLPWTVEPADGQPASEMYANLVTQMFEKIKPSFPDFIKMVLMSRPMGLSVTELVWNISDNLSIFPFRAVPSHKDRYVFDLDGELCIRSPIDLFWGERVPDRTFLTQTFDAMPGSFNDPAEEGRIFFGFGLNDVLYPTYFAKQIILRQDLRYLERFGNPIRKGRYPRKNEQGREAIQKMLDQLCHDQVMLFPSDDGYEVDLVEASGGGHRLFQDLIDYMDRQTSKAYLGSTLLLDIGDVGSYSLGRVHERTTFGRVAEFDHNATAGLFNGTLIPWIFELNQWPKEAMPTFRFTMKESHDITELMESLRLAQAMGYQVSAEMITESTGIRAARPGETILQFLPDQNATGGMKVTQQGGEADLTTLKGQLSILAEANKQPPGWLEMRKRVDAMENAMLMQRVNALQQRTA